MKTLGLASIAVLILMLIVVQGAFAQDVRPGCPWGSAYDLMANGYVPACFTGPADTTEAAVPAAQAEGATPDWTETPDWTDANPYYLLPPFASTVVTGPPAAVAQSVSTVCTNSGRDDTGMHSVVCYTAPAKVTQAAPKPAGLANINPVTKPAASTCLYGNAYDPLLMGPVAGCANGPTVSPATADPKPAGLANINPVAPQGQLSACGSAREIVEANPLAFPLACLSR
jgi:hypothetical protein